jgi:hypothetical protein
MKASQKIVDYIKIYARDPLAAYRDGKWWRSWMMDGTKAFMIGALHDGMEGYYQVRPDPELKAAIVKSLDWMIDHMWRPDSGGFVYEFNAMNRGHRSINTSLNFLFLDAFRFGYQLIGDRKYLAVALHGFAARLRDWEFPLDGKQFSIDVRRSPHIAAYLYKEKLSLDNLPDPPHPVGQEARPQPKLRRPEILLRASFEDGLDGQAADGRVEGQAVGKIAFVDGKRGKAIAVGNGGYAWFPAPREMLMAPGSVELWVRLASKRSKEKYDQSAIFHVEGKTPLVDTLGAMAIYHEFRVRMKDSVGHLNGTADAEISHWNPGEWHHAVVTWDDNRVKLFLDGVEQVRPDEGKYQWDAVEALPAGEQTRINLGWRFGNWYCDSAIDEFTVYGRALSSQEVREKYQTSR